MDLSIVIPVYNEGRKIAFDLDVAIQFLEEQKLSGEIIVVDDGSTDNSADVVKDYSVKHPGIICLINYHPNKGKGYAVKAGILKACGKIILFIDSGNCIPYSELIKGLESIGNNYTDIAHGSRHLKESEILIRPKFYRTVFSFLFLKFIRFYMNVPEHLTDTQCGLKMYRKDVAHVLFKQCQTDGFLFDIEVILLAGHNGYRIKEFPIKWTSDRDSRLKILTAFFRSIKEIKSIKRHIEDFRRSRL